MIHVAKLILINKDNKYLMLYRSEHPSFPNDPDLPGGTVEEGEQPDQALVREVVEETGISLEKSAIKKVYESSKYSKDSTYYLYMMKCDNEPEVNISWEHSRYEWLSLSVFIANTSSANDGYMHMVYEYLSWNGS